LKLTKRTLTPLPALILGSLLIAVPHDAKANLVGTVPTAPGSTVFPGAVPPGTPPGTLLADLVEPWSFVTTAGTTKGSFETAVYKEAGGTLDFYYQIMNNAASKTAIARETNTDFSQSSGVFTGFRTDGSTLTGTTFVDGTVPPVTADLNGSGNVVGFFFSPPDSSKILPGSTSNVLVISTNATHFTSGNASLIDGGTVTLNAFQPVSTVPEPKALIALVMGLVAMIGVRRFRAQELR
jgi:hypothetical protein